MTPKILSSEDQVIGEEKENHGS